MDTWKEEQKIIGRSCVFSFQVVYPQDWGAKAMMIVIVTTDNEDAGQQIGNFKLL